MTRPDLEKVIRLKTRDLHELTGAGFENAHRQTKNEFRKEVGLPEVFETIVDTKPEDSEPDYWSQKMGGI